MQPNRNIRLSIKNHISSLLQTYGYTNVYGEKDMRDVALGTLNPSGLFVFLVDSFISPTDTTLPFIVLEVNSIQHIVWELGSEEARGIRTYIHVFGKSRAERDDIAAYLQNNIGRSISYNDYSTGTPVPQAYPIERVTDDGSGIEINYAPPVTDEQLQERSLANWAILSFDARTKT